MTDKVVDGRVEDVLSSIKRLVGEEGRKIPDLVPSSLARKPGRLVLTDALRVEDNEDGKPIADPVVDASVKPMVLRARDAVESEASQPVPTPEKVPSFSLSSKIEALEAAIARTEDQWEPDGDSDDAYSGTPTRALGWSVGNEAKEDEVVEEGLSDTKATFIRDPEVIAATEAEEQPEPPAMDEDALRQLIAQVVREELQGVLGERFTRNVRKMVRREIYRALAEVESS
ncbi:hypothetical protein [Ruegeria lacuscaerulensis]|uniref:hypothetical protein n=1 Tax=Ruegeria lacuscaerulensis TaxID=55218 RepID=UPI001480F881|nr:hypothetical protein [Ruegeria lacuscaerulensis]